MFLIFELVFLIFELFFLIVHTNVYNKIITMKVCYCVVILQLVLVKYHIN